MSAKACFANEPHLRHNSFVRGEARPAQNDETAGVGKPAAKSTQRGVYMKLYKSIDSIVRDSNAVSK